MAMISAAAAAISFLSTSGTPALWLTPDGKLLMDGKPVQARALKGTRIVRVNGEVAYDFDGAKGGLLFGDPPALRLTGSMTVSLWINLRSYVNEGPGAQILFRGDDRNGLDPYFLAIHGDGTINFAVGDENYRIRHVSAEIPLGRWVQVVANFDEATGRMEMWLDGQMVGLAVTQTRPFGPLDGRWAPGVSIGNVQNDTGPHNQPLNGTIGDLRLYRGVLRPGDIPMNGPVGAEPP